MYRDASSIIDKKFPKTSNPSARRAGPYLFMAALAGLFLVYGQVRAEDGKSELDNARAFYPEDYRTDDADIYHGIEVPDPYRWLEDLESDRTQGWIAGQVALRDRILGEDLLRRPIRASLMELSDISPRGGPIERGGRFFVRETPPGGSGAILFVAGGAVGERRVLISAQDLAEDGARGVGFFAPSDDGTLVAYNRQKPGILWRPIYFRDVESGEDLDDVLPGTHWSGNMVVWNADSSGVYYTRYDEPDQGTEVTAERTNHRVMFHRIGTDAAEDAEIFRIPEGIVGLIGSRLSDDRRYLILHPYDEGSGTGVGYIDLDDPDLTYRELISTGDAIFTFEANDGPLFYLSTNDGADRSRVIAIDIRQPDRDDWREIVAEHPTRSLQTVQRIGGRLLLGYREGVKSLVEAHDLEGRHIHTVNLGGSSAYALPSFDVPESDVGFMIVGDPFDPGSLYRYSASTGAFEAVARPEGIGWSPDEFVTGEVEVESTDGVTVPLFIAHRRDIQLDGSNPVWMFAWGAGGSMPRPGFSAQRMSWMQGGGIYAIAYPRGGAIKGETWHIGGMKTRKINTIVDTIAAADWLVDEGYTAPGKLVVQSGSAAGVLPAGIANKRPNLFGAILTNYPILEMIRFPKFNGGQRWTGEYGDPDNPEEFRSLLDLSPYHNLKEGACLPPTLMIAGEMDDLVAPLHVYKYIAARQGHEQCGGPTLMRFQKGGGHYVNTPAEWVEINSDHMTMAARATGWRPAKGE